MSKDDLKFGDILMWESSDFKNVDMFVSETGSHRDGSYAWTHVTLSSDGWGSVRVVGSVDGGYYHPLKSKHKNNHWRRVE